MKTFFLIILNILFPFVLFADDISCSDLIYKMTHLKAVEGRMVNPRPELPKESSKYFNGRMTFAEYTTYFFQLYPDDQFYFATLLSQLPEGSHIIDANAGNGNAIITLLQTGFAKVNITAITSDLVPSRNVDFFIKNDEMASHLNLISGRTIVDVSEEELFGKFQKAQVIIDVAFYHPDNFEEVMTRYLNALDVGGSIFLSDRYFDSYLKRKGRPIYFENWLESISGVKIIRAENDDIIDDVTRKKLPSSYQIVKLSDAFKIP